MKTLILTLVALGASLPTLATPLTWNLTSVSSTDGDPLVGSFTYDAGTNTYSNPSITATGGIYAAAFQYLHPTFPHSSASVVFVSTSGALIGTPVLVLYFPSALTNAGGFIAFDLADSWEGICADDACTGGTDLRFFESGGVTASVAGVPEPASLGTITLGLGVLWRLRRRALASS